ncbi:VOC family protein [Geminicoccaceae bacterium 1502E]|nr:VOC family protein [Geminicoccaceae bacterium 1502E]
MPSLRFRQGPVASLLSSDLPGTIAFYRDLLGFELTAWDPDPDLPSWIQLRNGAVVLQFFADAAAGEPSLTGTLHLYPEDGVVSAAEALRGRVMFAAEPEMMPYGLLEFALLDPNGYRLAFSEEC